MKARHAASGRPSKAEVVQPPAGTGVTPTDISESFRSARSSLGQITTNLEQLRRHAASLVKSAKRRGAG